ncbi:hypothetical protein TIFTF001_044805 [Ficus carica]|uniref:Uncharacterized protein n=1 Tax=Ficus carica TaxID=3494 RepID=A0AA87ZHT9_FICCA|nr:hypothetical protein TIFTF001_044805 [Ficus carica]
MQDMKAGFALTNPTVTRVDWSGTNVAEEVVILDEPEQTTIPEQSTIPEHNGTSLCGLGTTGVRGLPEQILSIGTSLRGPGTTKVRGLPEQTLSIGTSLRGLGTTKVRGLLEQTLRWVLLRHLLRLTRVFLRTDPSLALVGVKHWDLSPWSGEH